MPVTHELRHAARTDRGLLRSNNQDSVFAGERLLVIADGMGGHAAGDVASRLVVAAFVPLDELPLGTDMRRPLVTATREGNAAIADMVAENPELEGMGTTLTALLFDGAKVALAHVGDSRAYLYRNGVLHQISHDDTFVQSLVDEGRITSDEAAHHPQRSLLLRALNGTRMDPAVSFREISPGDRFLLCSDGLSDCVAPESIADTLADPDIDQVADTLIQLALVAGGPDNVTVIVADVLDTGVDPAAGAPTVAIDLDPEATGPMQPIHLTQRMPRVPLPPIPEEPAARPEYVDGEDEDGEDFGEEDDHYEDDGYRENEDHPAESDGGAGGGGGPRGGDLATPPRRPRRKWRRWAAFALALIVLAGVAISASLLWTSSKYFVGNNDGKVSVFRGVSGSVLGVRLASVQEDSCGPNPATGCVPMYVNQLTQSARDQVNVGIPADGLPGARQIIERLRSQVLPPCPTTPSPVQLPTTSGSGQSQSGASSGGSVPPTTAGAPTTGSPSGTGRSATTSRPTADTRSVSTSTSVVTRGSTTVTITVTVVTAGQTVAGRSGEPTTPMRLRHELLLAAPTTTDPGAGTVSLTRPAAPKTTGTTRSTGPTGTHTTRVSSPGPRTTVVPTVTVTVTTTSIRPTSTSPSASHSTTTLFSSAVPGVDCR